MLPPGLHYEHRQHTGRKEAFCLTSFATFSDQTARSMLIFRREKKKLIKTYSLKLIKCSITSRSKRSREKNLYLRGPEEPVEAHHQTGK